ncbi:MAG: dioxygenase, partial [Stenotrophomonas sp.]
AGPESIEPWARDFRDWVVEKLAANDEAALHDYRRQAPHAERAHPTDEHFQPLHFALGAAGSEVLGAQRIDAGIDAGMLAMDIYRFDGEAAA